MITAYKPQMGEKKKLGNKRILFLLTLTASALICLTGCKADRETFATVTDNEVFQDVPLMTGTELKFSDVTDVGAGNFMLIASNSTKGEYDAYLLALKQDGFKKHVDNGAGLDGAIYTSHYLKDDLLVVVSYISKKGDTVITVCKDAVLSEHLLYKDKYVADNKDGAKTSLTMPELFDIGNSFVLQLKNGHFIINDGGIKKDLPYLLDYLDSLTPDGEKPVVDAWIISHAHLDHMGVFVGFFENKEYINRVYVEEVYFTEVSAEAQASDASNYDKADTLCFYCTTIPTLLKNTQGKPPKQIRMRLGERYFFNDITFDVIFTPDMLPCKEWKTWNTTSVVLMYTIENQKMMMMADCDWECQAYMLKCFNDDYFDMAIYQAPHHGGNVYNEFSRHIKADTILYPASDVERMKQYPPTSLLSRYEENKYLRSRADEALGWGDGGIYLTFPYAVGSYEVLPLNEWIYDSEKPKNR